MFKNAHYQMFKWSVKAQQKYDGDNFVFKVQKSNDY